MTELIVALVTLTVLEVVLGVDNVIFISILSGKLPKDQQKRARRVGLLAAMVMRIALLFSITWMARLTTPLFGVLGRSISGRDLILIVRRPVPAREGHLRNSRPAGGRVRARRARRSPRSAP